MQLISLVNNFELTEAHFNIIYARFGLLTEQNSLLCQIE